MLSSGMVPTAMSAGKMMYLNHFNHLNTIEEEKHETQTSNYFKEGESERDDSKVVNANQSYQDKGSRILGELTKDGDGFISQSKNNKDGHDDSESPNKSSPQMSRRDPDYNFKGSG